MVNLERSSKALEDARKYIPGGVNSPVRSYRSVGSTPPFIMKAKGSKIYDIDQNQYIDYVLSWGPMILGHAHHEIVKALHFAVENGTSYGAPTELETMMAERICRMVPHIDMVRMVNSGTEATMSALRLARAYTKRNKIVKCEGCYHGHSDSLLVKAGSGLATFGEPDSPGVTPNVAADTLTVPYNDLEAMEALFKAEGDHIAAVIIEPVAGNMGCVPPVKGYLEGLRKVTADYGALLIFDEVMCGFRASATGAQGKYNIAPDLTCLGKIVGGGLPMAAFGGKREIMEQISPSGPVYQAGTLSGNPLAMSAGLATLSCLEKNPVIFEKVERQTEKLCKGLEEAASYVNIPVQIQRVGSMFTIFFTDKPVHNFDDANSTDDVAFRAFFHASLEQGIYYAPSRFESNFMSASHSDEDIEKTIEAAKIAFKAAKDARRAAQE